MPRGNITQIRYNTYITIGNEEKFFRNYSTIGALAQDMGISRRLATYIIAGTSPKRSEFLKCLRIERIRDI